MPLRGAPFSRHKLLPSRLQHVQVPDQSPQFATEHRVDGMVRADKAWEVAGCEENGGHQRPHSSARSPASRPHNSLLWLAIHKWRDLMHRLMEGPALEWHCAGQGSTSLAQDTSQCPNWLTCEGLTYRLMHKPLPARVGTRVALGWFWQTQVT